jgi:hypothetical protein
LSQTCFVLIGGIVAISQDTRRNRLSPLPAALLCQSKAAGSRRIPAGAFEATMLIDALRSHLIVCDKVSSTIAASPRDAETAKQFTNAIKRQKTAWC